MYKILKLITIEKKIDNQIKNVPIRVINEYREKNTAKTYFIINFLLCTIKLCSHFMGLVLFVSGMRLEMDEKY